MFPFASGDDGGGLEAFAVERCGECGAEKKRPFRAGDVLFADAGRCGSCGGGSSIDRIFGEAPDGGGGGAAGR